MNKTLKALSVVLSVLMIVGVMSVANPVLAAEANEDYLMTQALSLQSETNPALNTLSLGVEDRFDYHVQDVGRAGTVYVNDYSGQVHIERDDMSLYCPYMPVQLVSYYNSGITDIVSGMGYGWRTSYNQSVEYNAVDDTFLYYDGNGKVIYFENANSVVNQKQKWVQVESDFTTDYGYILYSSTTDYNSLSQVTIESENGLIKSFDSSGYLTKISKSVKNSETSSEETEYSTEIEYLTVNSLRLISKITDGIGREYRFSYTQNSNTGDYLLTSIQAYDSIGTAISIGSKPYKLVFGYDYVNIDGVSYPSLSTVTYPDGEIVEYTLNETNFLLKDIDGYAIEINNVSETTQTITEKAYTSSTAFTNGAVLTAVKTNDYEKVFTDKNNISKTKQFDVYGRTINSLNNDGTVIPVTYSIDEKACGEHNENLYNLDYYSSTYASDNLISNGSFSNAKTGWEATNATVVSEHSNSLKFTVCGTDYVWASQVVDVSGGAENDEYVVEFTTKQVNATANSDVFSLVHIEARNNTSGSESWETIDSVEVNPFNSNWQAYSYKFKIQEVYNEIKISLCYNQIGEAYFDDVKLFKFEAVDETPLEASFSGSWDYEINITDEYYANGAIFKLTGDDKDFAISTSFSESNWYNQILSDVNNNTINYVFDSKNGLLTHETDGNNASTSYVYDAVGKLTNISKAVDGLSNGSTLTTSYTYEDDRIKSITHNGFSYNYTYDVWGNVTAVKVGSQNLVAYDYGSDANKGQTNRITYGNGDYVAYTYENELVTSAVYYKADNTVTGSYTYTYNTLGELAKIKDNIGKIETDYTDNSIIITFLNDEATSADDYVYNTYTVNDNGTTVENYGGMCYNSSEKNVNYDSDTGIVTTDYTLSSTLKDYEFSSQLDFFGRKLNTKVSSFYEEQDGVDVNIDFYSEYDYKDLSSTQTSSLIDTYKSVIGFSAVFDGEPATMTLSEKEYSLEYDNIGNISRIYLKEYDEEGNVVSEETFCSYTYDKAGQLVRENNATLGTTTVYIYDIGGNLVSKTEYAFTETTDLSGLTPTSTTNLTYDTVWRDKLVNFGGTAISYDSMGNPLNYVGRASDGDEITGNLTWNGRQLASAEIDGKIYKYSYNADGLRVKTDTYDSETNEYEGGMHYLWRDGKLAGYTMVDSDGNLKQTIKMLLDTENEALGYTYYDPDENTQETYYFAKNVYGDIETVYDEYGDAIVSYSYDAWGNVTPQAHGSSLQAALKAMLVMSFTPITYRGYNYDINTGLYYLQTRYYNPNYGRFLNADTTEILERTKGTVLGANIFAYCNNNPVMYVDYTGEVSLIALAVSVLIFGVIIAAFKGVEVKALFEEWLINHGDAHDEAGIVVTTAWELWLKG